MKIVIYSSNSNIFDGNIFHYYNFPENYKFWEKYSEHNFVFVTELPGLFLLDINQNEIAYKAKNVEYIIRKPDADFIESLNPDVVIAATFWVIPFDWLPINDALIGEQLKNMNIKTYAHSVKTAQICFDKRMTHDFLLQNNFNVASGIYVHHELFWAERNHQEIKENFYKESVLYQIKKLNFPVVIKDTVGLSSYGMEVCTTYPQAAAFLKSKKNNGDKIVEEYIPGLQFGTEIHGSKETGWKVFYPFMFSVNKYGITSPKQSIKLGPVQNKKFNFDELESELKRLAMLMDFSGVAQIDLVFNKGKWFIIEINPRLSGMTQTIIESNNKLPVFAFKLPIIDEQTIAELRNYPFIKHISQVVNDAAKQRRECGYCEIIFTGNTADQLKENLDILKEKYPDLIDKGFYESAQKMLIDAAFVID